MTPGWREGPGLTPGWREGRGGTPGWREDRGAASILILAIGLVMVAGGLAGAAVQSARVARHAAQNAADLGALAGATQTIFGSEVACGRAARFVAANDGRMTACTVAGLEIVVRAEMTVRPMPGMIRHATASARAGPIQAPAT